VWWSGSVRELSDWIRARALQPRVALLWLALLAATLAAGANGSPAWTAGATALLVVQFRLWDDLEDIPYDRNWTPDRVLVRTGDLRFLWAAAGTSFALVATALAYMQGPIRAGAYVLVTVGVASLYRAMDPTGPRRALRSRLVLLKYPAFVLLLAEQAAAASTLISALLIYVALVSYEQLESRRDWAR